MTIFLQGQKLHFDTEDLKYFDFLSCHTRCRTVVAMLNNYRVPSSETLCTCFAALSILGQEPGAKQRAAIKIINQAAAIHMYIYSIMYEYITALKATQLQRSLSIVESTYSMTDCSYILYFQYIQYTSTSMSMYCTVYWDIYTITDIFIYSRKYDRLQLHPVLYIYEYEYVLYTGIYTMTKNFIKYICSMKDCSCMLYLYIMYECILESSLRQRYFI